MAATPREQFVESSAEPAQPVFLMVHCAQCQREVLSACDLDAHGDMVDVCLHCGTHLDRDDESARWVDADFLDAHGYFVEGNQRRDDRHGGGGCRGKACGVQQPE